MSELTTLSGNEFLWVTKPNQQHQSTEGQNGLNLMKIGCERKESDKTFKEVYSAINTKKLQTLRTETANLVDSAVRRHRLLARQNRNRCQRRHLVVRNNEPRFILTELLTETPQHAWIGRLSSHHRPTTHRTRSSSFREHVAD